jgi:hypothetical protein
VDGQIQKLGFYVTRVIGAENPAEEENAAVDLIREDARLKDSVLNDRDDPPMLYAEEIEEIETSDAEKNVNTGFAWYHAGEA